MTEHDLAEISLPDGDRITVLAQGKLEAKFLYNEIYTTGMYLKNGIRIQDGDCIFDLGANIGLFTRYLTQRWSNLDVRCFEPVPIIYQALKKNMSEYQRGNHITIHNIGVSDTTCEKEINFIAGMPGNSTVYHEEKVGEIDLILEGIRLKDLWLINKTMFPFLLLLYPFRRRIVGRLWRRLCSKSYHYTCQFEPLSKIIEEGEIKRINLLKIDVEGSELDVIRGISDRHWKIIDQVVMECSPHNNKDLPNLRDLLARHNFTEIVIERLGNKIDLDSKKSISLPTMVYAIKN